ncbi:MAG: putative transcriptional regulator [Saprospiraceae bacterium]|jgi:putative transcriptional regulator
MTYIKQQIAKGKVLIAEPFMQDPNFKRGVILLCEHDKEGSIGFILNKSLEMDVSELIADFPAFEAQVYFGGPVQKDTIHYVHNVGDLLEDSNLVCPGVFWGGDFEKLKFLITSKMIEPKNIRFFVGYTGWSEGQLEDEMVLGSWVIGDMHSNYLFKTSPDTLWKKALQHKGNTYSVIAQMPDGISFS